MFRLLPSRRDLQAVFIGGLAVATIVLGVRATMSAAGAPPPSKDTFSMTALTSSNGVVPTSNGNPSEWFYAYCTSASTPVIDTLHTSQVVTNTNGVTPQSYTVTYSGVGGLLSAFTLPSPASFSMSDNGAAVMKDIGLNTGILAPGTYAGQIQIDATPASGIQPSHTTVHVQVTVGDGCGGGSSSCFFTDSDYNLLHDCAGAEVTGNSGGTFQIVANGKKITATNPGQFYYNMIWTNPGATQDVQINLNASNLTPMGANSVHAYVFDTAGFSANLTSWELVNSNGTPCGPSGPCTVNVPLGKTLWVTWHLEYAKIGQPPTGLSSDCATSTEMVGAACQLSDPDNGTVLAQCQATAKGYLKK